MRRSASGFLDADCGPKAAAAVVNGLPEAEAEVRGAA